MGAVTAQSESASVTLSDQESDGESMTIESLETPVDARLVLVVDQEDTILDRELDADTSFTDRTVELDAPLRESKTVLADLRTADYEERLAADRAVVAVGESLSTARSTITLPSGRAEIVDPQPDAGFELPYVLYRPDTPADPPRPVLVFPLNGPPVETDAELRTQLRDVVRRPLLAPARELGLPAIVPGIPRTPDDGPDWVQSLALPSRGDDGILERIATDAFPAASLERVDEQVVGMIDDARVRLSEDGSSVASGIHMTGFSASAQFSARFSLLNPSLVDAISVGGNGAYPLPLESRNGVELRYPLGVADYDDVTGRAFDPEAWRNTSQYVFVGREDQPLPDTDERGYYPISYRYDEAAVDTFGENRVTERLPVTEAVYTAAGADATFRVYDGVGHTLTEEMAADTVQFHREVASVATDTPTSTPTQTATPTDTPTPTGHTPTPTDAAGSSGTSTPGFGVPAAVAGLGTGVYLLARGLRRDTDE